MKSTSERVASIRKEEAATPPTAVLYFTREALRRLWRSRRTSSVSIGMITIAVFILGLFLLVAENLRQTVDLWEGSSKVSLYLRPDATPQQLSAIQAHLNHRALLEEWKFVSREEALSRFRKHFSSLSGVVDELDENPFPASFEVHVEQPQIQDPRFDDEVRRLKSLPGVEDVQFDWQWVERLRRIIRAVNLVGFFAGGILAIAAAFTTANVIRLGQVLYREEISIMRLVGATETMVRGPFLIEGIAQGLLGATLASGFLFALFFTAQQLAERSPSLLWSLFVATFLPWHKVLLLIGGGMLAGLVGSWLSLLDYSEEVPA